MCCWTGFSVLLPFDSKLMWFGGLAGMLLLPLFNFKEASVLGG